MNIEKTPLSWFSHGARYFDPQLATWHSPDPLSESSTSLSPYTYVANNPVNYVDPNGMYYAKGPSPLEREYTQKGRGLSFSTSLFWNPCRPQFWTAVPSFEDQYLWIEGSEGGAYVKRENILTFDNSGDDAVSVFVIGFLTNNWSGSFDINGISIITSEGVVHLYYSDGPPNPVNLENKPITSVLAWYIYLEEVDYYNPKNERYNKYQLRDIIDYTSTKKLPKSSLINDAYYKIKKQMSFRVGDEILTSQVNLQFDDLKHARGTYDQYIGSISTQEYPSYYSIEGLNSFGSSIISVIFSNYEVFNNYFDSIFH